MKGIWQEDNEYYRLAHLTDEAIILAEKKLNVTLPQAYLKILKEQNGGYIIFNAFPTNVPTSWADNHINVDHILGIGEENSILDSEYLINEWDLPQNVVLISGDGHSWVALDYRDRKEKPQVIYIDSEDNQVIHLANSFEEFLEGLYIKEGFEGDCDNSFEQDWTHEELKIALSSNDNDQIISAFNYLYEKQAIGEFIETIENSILDLLSCPNKQLKEISALYATHFSQKGTLSFECKKKVVAILQEEEELRVYIDML